MTLRVIPKNAKSKWELNPPIRRCYHLTISPGPPCTSISRIFMRYIYTLLFTGKQDGKGEGRKNRWPLRKGEREGGKKKGWRKEEQRVLREEGRDGSTKEEQKGVLPLSPCVQGWHIVPPPITMPPPSVYMSFPSLSSSPSVPLPPLCSLCPFLPHLLLPFLLLVIP